MSEHTGRLRPQGRRSRFPIAVAIVMALAATALLSGCGAAGTVGGKSTAAQPVASTLLEVPLMDSTAPSVFETASFALG